MDHQNLLLELESGIATLTINRPEKLNALNRATILELNMVLEKLAQDKAVRALIVTGSGTKAFVAGADISEFAGFAAAQGEALARDGQTLLFDKIAHFPKPVIAAINGFALGGGLELAMAAHVRLASENAKMGLPELSLGVIPGYGGTQRLPQLIGRGRAYEMLFSARMVDAQTALNWGLVNKVCRSEELLVEAKAMAISFLKNSTQASAAAIAAVEAGFRPTEKGFTTEINSFGSCFQSHDFIEGTTAFLEKRKPDFN
jgi:enoyl-CoA hydratase